MHHFKAIGTFKLGLQSGNTQFGLTFGIFCPLWPWNRRLNLKKNRASFLCYPKLCVPFRSHWGIQSGVTVRKRPNCGKICFDLCDIDLWSLTLAFRMAITLVITPENFVMIQRQEQCEKGMTGGRTDELTDRSVLRVAWSQLKIKKNSFSRA